MVTLLAFDTSSSACSVALQKDDKVMVRHEVAIKQQGSLILTLINELLNSFFVNFNQLDAVLFGGGPGSFTGTRIASSVAQAIGLGATIPIIRISSLAVRAQTAYLLHQWQKILVVLDAHGGEVYIAAYEVNQAGRVELIGDEKIGLPQEVSSPFSTSEWYGIGDGWLKYENILFKSLKLKPKMLDAALLPQAEAMLKLAPHDFNQGEVTSFFEVIPRYLR